LYTLFDTKVPCMDVTKLVCHESMSWLKTLYPNMPPRSVAAPVCHESRGWLNDSECLNMPTARLQYFLPCTRLHCAWQKVLTELVCHELMFWLNALVPENMPYALVTELVCHESRGWLNLPVGTS